MLDRLDDTIFGLATAPGEGAIAVVRVSGTNALSIVRRFCHFLPEVPDSHRVYYGHWRSLDADTPLDEILITYFAKGRSFTTEPTFEISFHGSTYIVKRAYEDLLSAGARLSDRGEFTFRAFVHGRLDLVQAENVLSLVQSSSQGAHDAAIAQLSGLLSRELNSIAKEITWVLAHLEANIDFATEDIVVAEGDVLLKHLDACLEKIASLKLSYRHGKVLKDGIQAVLCGEPNVGKSSLLNRFLGEERAIVTEFAGTTRDVLEGVLTVEGLPVRLFDTAGWRTADDEGVDPVERIGLEKAQAYIERADVLIWVLDATSWPFKLNFVTTSSVPVIAVVNKWDAIDEGAKPHLEGEIRQWVSESFSPSRIVFVSAATGAGLESVLQAVIACTGFDSKATALLTHSRHYEGLQRAFSAVSRGRELLMDTRSSYEFVAFELMEGLRALHSILGIVYDDQVMDLVFKEFCLGK